MQCLVCYKTLDGNICPRCGFQHVDIIGDSEKALELQKSLADMYRPTFLKRYNVGVTSYFWKDDNGEIVLDTAKRLPFGTADVMINQTVWLDQEFARIPDEEELTIELSVKKDDAEAYPVQVRLPALKEKQLQKIGVSLTDDLKLRLVLKNQDSQVSSAPTDFFQD